MSGQTPLKQGACVNLLHKQRIGQLIASFEEVKSVLRDFIALELRFAKARSMLRNVRPHLSCNPPFNYSLRKVSIGSVVLR